MGTPSPFERNPYLVPSAAALRRPCPLAAAMLHHGTRDRLLPPDRPCRRHRPTRPAAAEHRCAWRARRRPLRLRATRVSPGRGRHAIRRPRDVRRAETEGRCGRRQPRARRARRARAPPERRAGHPDHLGARDLRPRALAVPDADRALLVQEKMGHKSSTVGNVDLEFYWCAEACWPAFSPSCACSPAFRRAPFGEDPGLMTCAPANHSMSTIDVLVLSVVRIPPPFPPSALR